MDWLHKVADFAGSGSVLGIAIAVANAETQRLHIGIVHQPEEGPAKLLHLAWHITMKNEPVDQVEHLSNLVWVLPELPEERLVNLAARCRLIWSNYAEKGIPYGVHYGGGSFDPNGLLKLWATM